MLLVDVCSNYLLSCNFGAWSHTVRVEARYGQRPISVLAVHWKAWIKHAAVWQHRVSAVSSVAPQQQGSDLWPPRICVGTLMNQQAQLQSSQTHSLLPTVTDSTLLSALSQWPHVIRISHVLYVLKMEMSVWLVSILIHNETGVGVLCQTEI